MLVDYRDRLFEEKCKIMRNINVGVMIKNKNLTEKEILECLTIFKYDTFDNISDESIISISEKLGGAPYGKFIVIEGTDHSGKDTIINELKEKYKDRRDVVFTREPGGTPISEKIRDIILDNSNGDMSNECEVFLYYASRIQHIIQKIIPLRKCGYHVISSRYFDSSYAYQLAGRGLSEEYLDTLTNLITEDALSIPTHVVSLYLSEEKMDSIVKDMIEDGRELDRLENSGIEFLKKTNDYFRTLEDKRDVVGIPYDIFKFKNMDCDKEESMTYLKNYFSIILG